MNKRERELMQMMRNPCFYKTLREHIHEFLVSYKRLKKLKVYTQEKSPKSWMIENYRAELRAFYEWYIALSAYRSLYNFCKLDRKINEKRV